MTPPKFFQPDHHLLGKIISPMSASFTLDCPRLSKKIRNRGSVPAPHVQGFLLQHLTQFHNFARRPAALGPLRRAQQTGEKEPALADHDEERETNYCPNSDLLHL
jgi:hypothetical protein